MFWIEEEAYSKNTTCNLSTFGGALHSNQLGYVMYVVANCIYVRILDEVNNPFYWKATEQNFTLQRWITVLMVIYREHRDNMMRSINFISPLDSIAFVFFEIDNLFWLSR